MLLEISLILVLIIILNVFTHCIAIGLIIHVVHMKADHERKIHLSYLMSIFISELIACILTLVLMAISNSSQSIATTASINLILLNLSYIPYIALMCIILIDKVLEIMLPFKYIMYWSIAKARGLVFTVWIIGCIVCIVQLLLYHLKGVSFIEYSPIFMLTTGAIFVVIASLSYTYIFYKFKKSRLLPTRFTLQHNQKSNWFTVFKKSRFFIPVSMISNFLLFQVIPMGVFLFLLFGGLLNAHNSNIIRMFIAVSYNLSTFINSLIGIFLERQIKMFIKKKIRDRKIRKECKFLQKHRCKMDRNRNTVIHKRFSSRVVPRSFIIVQPFYDKPQRSRYDPLYATS